MKVADEYKVCIDLEAGELLLKNQKMGKGQDILQIKEENNLLSEY